MSSTCYNTNMRPKTLVVMIPCLNEEASIGEVIKQIPKKIPKIAKVKILVINDGSTDKSVEIAKKHGAHILSHPIHRGLGVTFRDGIERALRLGADIIVNIDGDLQFNPKDIKKMVKPITDQHYNFVTATRYVKYLKYNSKGRGIKNWGNKFFAKLIWRITGEKYTDVSCGFRAYSRQAAQKLSLFGHFTYTHETFLDLIHKGYKAYEVPIKVRPNREKGKSNISGNLYKYGISALKIIVRGFRDHQPLKFFGILSLITFFIGFIVILHFTIHWSITGSMSPFKSYAIGGAFLVVISFLLFVLALLADMIGRVKDLEEDIVYRLRRFKK